MYANHPVKKKVCAYCGQEMVMHVNKEGARYHVLTWYGSWDPVNMRKAAVCQCSETDCEVNHGPGHCVPFEREREDDGTQGYNFNQAYKAIARSDV